MATLEEIFVKETKTKKETATFRAKADYYERYCDWLEVVVKQLKDVVKDIPILYDEKPWTTFYFEGNQAWGIIDSPKEWDRIKKAYEDTTVYLAAAQMNPNKERPSFGFYWEYNGTETLGEFAKANNMDLKVHEEQCMISINGICSCNASIL